MFCQKCGVKAIDDAEFCQKCGAKLFVEIPAEQPEETSVSVNPIPEAPPAPANVPEKEKSKKLPIIFGIVALVATLLIVLIYLGENKSLSSNNTGRGNPSQKYDNETESNSVRKVELSQSYVNEAEGFSFKYPAKFEPVDDEELSDYTDMIGVGKLLVYLFDSSEMSGIMVYKIDVMQDEIDDLVYSFASDELFASMNNGFDDYDEIDTVKEISVTEIDGVPAGKATFLDYNGISHQGYLYVSGSALYQIDFNWKGESPGDNQRIFDAILNSYTIFDVGERENSTGTSARAESSMGEAELLYNGSSACEWIGMSIDTIMNVWGDPLAYMDFEGAGEETRYCQYDGIEFGFTGDRAIYSVSMDSRACTFDGVLLNRNRSELISIFGTPTDEDSETIYNYTTHEVENVYYYLIYDRFYGEAELRIMFPSSDAVASEIMLVKWPW